jgi:hypothetical protein
MRRFRSAEAFRKVKPRRSAAAQRIERWSVISYRICVFLAVCTLVIALGFAALSPEPLWLRLMTIAVLGILPAVASCAAGILLFWFLLVVGAICDLAAPWSEPTRLILAQIGRVIQSFLISLFSVCLKALRLSYRVARRVVVVAHTFLVFLLRALMTCWRSLVMTFSCVMHFVARIFFANNRSQLASQHAYHSPR